MALSMLAPPAPERDGNSAQLLVGGVNLFPKALQAIEQAKHEVRIETYIFADDAVGQAFFEAMCNAAARGIKVCLVLDGFGGTEGIQVWVPRLKKQGVKVRVFRPEGFLFEPSPRRLRRMHRKMIAVDGQVAFVGGINLIDDMNHDTERKELMRANARVEKPVQFSFGKSGTLSARDLQVNKDLLDQDLGPRYDFAVALKGPVVHDIWHSMEWLWLQIGPGGKVTDTLNSDWWKRRINQYRHTLAQHRAQALPPVDGKVKVQLVVRDNFRLRRRIERAYLQAIGRAQSTVILANAYFLPGRKMRNAIAAARKRGVVVKLLLQGRVEYRFQHHATQYLYSSLLDEGVEVYEYLPGFLHAKVAVIDANWATVGSSNLDPLSSLFAREANVIVHNREFAGQLRKELMQAIEQGGRQVLPQAHAQRPFKARALSWLCYKLTLLAVFLGAFGSRY